MKLAHAIAILAAAVSGCHLPARPPAELHRLVDDGEVWFYLQPLGGDTERIGVELTSASAVRTDGAVLPLTLRLARIARVDGNDQRLLAWGRLPPGSYEGVDIGIAKATLVGEDGVGVSDLLVPSEPVLVPVPFTIAAGKAAVMTLEFRGGASVSKRFALTPAFSAGPAPRPVSQLAGYCSSAAAASVVAFDRLRRSVGDVIPTGVRPRGLALEPVQLRLYVANGGDDEVDVFDTISGTALPPLRLQPGDGPAEIALAPDGRTLLVTNERTNSLSFIDLRSQSEVARLPVGDSPRGLVLDRTGQRAFVLDVRSNAITVVDVPNRAVVTTVGTEPEPLRVAPSRDGSRLYAVFAGSPYVTVYALPGFAVLSRVFVGLGARTVLVDSRTDLVYVGGDLDRVVVLDPMALVPIDAIELPGEVSWLAIADAEDALFALVSDRSRIVAVDVTSHHVLAAMDVGEAPYQLVLSGQRR